MTDNAVMPKHQDEETNLEHLNSHDFQILLTGTGKKVLEICSELGSITKILSERDCDVTIIEVKNMLSKRIEKFADRVLVRDLETSNLKEIVGAEKYDIILISDILSRLKEPTLFLKQIREFLVHNGHIVFSVPNITNAINRIKFLNGEFKYAENGLIDKNHLCFFTLDSILSMIDTSGYSITQLFRVKQEIQLSSTDIKQYRSEERRVGKECRL